MKSFFIVPIFFYLLGQALAASTNETSPMAANSAEVKKTEPFPEIPMDKFLRCLDNVKKATETATGLKYQDVDDEILKENYVWCLDAVTPGGARLNKRPKLIYGDSKVLANL
ncbi:hypothetical protein HF325_003954 [Metschnikowia pulcherrima]|uniref:Uncharacterized protein n=1 Tax=Metschnikowia pulcherrima TaxID=27326 RepID=A0A8H7LB35_9ASCO|nr:hypothetical protein HF325_003954 [Metschnikowia pulcherrima]